MVHRKAGFKGLKRRLLLTGAFVLGIAFVLPAVMPSPAYAQDQAGSGSGSGFFGKLFNKGSDGNGAQPLFINRKAPTANVINGSAATTGIATNNGSSSAGASPLRYGRVSSGSKELTVSEIVEQDTIRGRIATDKNVAQKEAEAAAMTAQYKKDMQERLAAQQQDPSMMQAAGASGSAGMDAEAVKRRMIYQKKDAADVKKPIRLFDVQ